MGLNAIYFPSRESSEFLLKRINEVIGPNGINRSEIYEIQLGAGNYCVSGYTLELVREELNAIDAVDGSIDGKLGKFYELAKSGDFLYGVNRFGHPVVRMEYEEFIPNDSTIYSKMAMAFEKGFSSGRVQWDTSPNGTSLRNYLPEDVTSLVEMALENGFSPKVLSAFESGMSMWPFKYAIADGGAGDGIKTSVNQNNPLDIRPRLCLGENKMLEYARSEDEAIFVMKGYVLHEKSHLAMLGYGRQFGTIPNAMPFSSAIVAKTDNQDLFKDLLGTLYRANKVDAMYLETLSQDVTSAIFAEYASPVFFDVIKRMETERLENLIRDADKDPDNVFGFMDKKENYPWIQMAFAIQLIRSFHVDSGKIDAFEKRVIDEAKKRNPAKAVMLAKLIKWFGLCIEHTGKPETINYLREKFPNYMSL